MPNCSQISRLSWHRSIAFLRIFALGVVAGILPAGTLCAQITYSGGDNSAWQSTNDDAPSGEAEPSANTGQYRSPFLSSSQGVAQNVAPANVPPASFGSRISDSESQDNSTSTASQPNNTWGSSSQPSSAAVNYGQGQADQVHTAAYQAQVYGDPRSDGVVRQASNTFSSTLPDSKFDSNAPSENEGREPQPISPKNNSRSSKPIPLRPNKEGEQGGVVKPTTSTTGAIVSMISSLTIVVSLFLVAAWIYRKSQTGSGSQLPSEVITVLGGMAIGPRQQIQLIRVGGKVIVAANSAGDIKTLTEITDPDEVAKLCGQCEQAKSGSITQSFRSVFAQVSNNRPSYSSRPRGLFPFWGRKTAANTNASRSYSGKRSTISRESQVPEPFNLSGREYRS